MPHYMLTVADMKAKETYIFDRVYGDQGGPLTVAATHARKDLGFTDCLSLGFDKAKDDEKILEARLGNYRFRIIPVYVQPGRGQETAAPVFQLLHGGKK